MKYFSLILTTLIIACSQKNTTADEQAIRDILKRDQQAHLEKNAELLLSNISLDFIEVNRGVVKRPTYEESTVRFTNYFNSVNFLTWEDIENPIIRFSDDGSLAYVIVQKRVITTPIDNPTLSADTSDFAWVSIMRKSEGRWKVECIASTNR